MTTKQELDNFYAFATARIANGGAKLSMDEIYSLWRIRPSPSELAESAAACRAAYAEYQAGERGKPARELLREMYQESGLDVDE